MNEMLTAMSTDMGIDRFQGEADDNFAYRLCYSALGQWCLHTAKNSENGNTETTKHNQTIVLNELIMRYSELFPMIADRFVDTSSLQVDLSVHIRRVYEETGYLLTDASNRNRLANFSRSIPVGSTALFSGIPDMPYSINGLGVFGSPTEYKVTISEFLIRDNLKWEEYFQSQFDSIDFYDRDINLDELEFFNPLSSNVPSQSWERHMNTDYAVARKGEWGPFYRVMRMPDNSLLFADEPMEPQSDSFVSYEFRRLYFALKAYYKNPLQAIVTRKDATYSEIRLRGHLPNREYYFLLLLSWPINNAFDKVNYLIKNDFIPEIIYVLANIGIEVKGGSTNA